MYNIGEMRGADVWGAAAVIVIRSLETGCFKIKDLAG